MDWLQVARAIAPLAPALGGLLGGFIPFPGGGIAGQALGNVIAKALGVPATPEAVMQAVTTTDNDVLIARLNAASEEAKSMWPAMAAIEAAYIQGAVAVNQTMQAEIGHEHWFFNGWRPMSGWLFVFFALAYGIILIIAVWRAGAGDPVLWNAVKEVQYTAIAHLGALAAVVGVYIIGRSTEKRAALVTGTVATTPQPPKKK